MIKNHMNVSANFVRPKQETNIHKSIKKLDIKQYFNNPKRFNFDNANANKYVEIGAEYFISAVNNWSLGIAEMNSITLLSSF